VRRVLVAAVALAAMALLACSSKAPPVQMTTGCDGPDGSCARYVQAIDKETAPIDGSTLIVPFTREIKTAEKPWDLFVVTGAFNFETRQTEYKLIAVRSVKVDPRNKRQLVIEVDGLLSDGSGIDLPDGLVLDGSGKSAGAFTVKVKTPFSPFAVALAGVMWEPSDRTLFGYEGTEKPKGVKEEGPVRAELEARLRLRPRITDEQVATVLQQYDGEQLKKKVPDHRVRAGLLMLTGTSAEAAIAYIAADKVRSEAPFQPLKTESLARYGAFAVVMYNPFTAIMQMIIDTDLAADTLENIAVVLSHETLHSSIGGGSGTEETLAMASNTRIYEELLLFDPTLALTPTDFTRQNNELLLAMRNSGRFNFPYAGVLPRLGVDDALRGVGREPALSFKDLLFAPDFYGSISRTGDRGNEVLEAYYQRIAGTRDKQGYLRWDTSTLKLFDVALDHGFTDENILTIVDALRLKPVPRGGR
jgi:hypothetical protein